MPKLNDIFINHVSLTFVELHLKVVRGCFLFCNTLKTIVINEIQ